VAPSTLFDASLLKLFQSRQWRLFFRPDAGEDTLAKDLNDGLWITSGIRGLRGGPRLALTPIRCSDAERVWGVWRMSDDRFGAAAGRQFGPEPVAFGRRLAASEAFRAMFREGMSLVEETATYLDGDGRRESHRLARAASLAYATESMRLTTRLMQLASWLLLQRAVNEGDLTADQANHERSKVKLGGLSTATEGAIWNELPARLKVLIDRSLRLQERVVKLDESLRNGTHAEARENRVLLAQTRIAEAFSGK
jgi:regulator of CtrA degradation